MGGTTACSTTSAGGATPASAADAAPSKKEIWRCCRSGGNPLSRSRVRERLVLDFSFVGPLVGAPLGEAGPDVVDSCGLCWVLRPAEGGDQVRVVVEILLRV